MVNHWINELMNLLAGNSRYIFYTPGQQRLFMLGILLFSGISFLFRYSLFNR